MAVQPYLFFDGRCEEAVELGIIDINSLTASPALGRERSPWRKPPDPRKLRLGHVHRRADGSSKA